MSRVESYMQNLNMTQTLEAERDIQTQKTDLLPRGDGEGMDWEFGTGGYNYYIQNE